jgi:hypothetical protein
MYVSSKACAWTGRDPDVLLRSPSHSLGFAIPHLGTNSPIDQQFTRPLLSQPHHTRLTMRLLTSRTLSRTLISQPSRRFKSTDTSAALPPRWLSDVKSRIGKCIMFGINAEQTAEAGGILEEMNADWRELVAGSEGYLTGREWMGLCRQEVVWGEMVCDS